MDVDDEQVTELRAELREAATSTIQDAIDRLKQDGTPTLRILREFAQEHFPEKWAEDPAQAVEAVIRAGIEGLSGKLAPQDDKITMSLQEAAYRVYNITAPETGYERETFKNVEGKRYAHLVQQLRTAINIPSTDKRLDTWLRELRHKLAISILRPGFPAPPQPEPTPAQPDAEDVERTEGVSPRKRWLIPGVVVGVVLLVVIGVVIALANQDQGSPTAGSTPSRTSNPAPTNTQTSEPSPSVTISPPVPPCTEELPPESRLSKDLLAKRQAVVDGRCDDDPEAPLGAYNDPSQDLDSVAQLRTGFVLPDICLVTGEFIRNNKHGSDVWVEFALGDRRAYVPAVYVLGETTARSCSDR